jgi:hypothetical protein
MHLFMPVWIRSSDCEEMGDVARPRCLGNVDKGVRLRTLVG